MSFFLLCIFPSHSCLLPDISAAKEKKIQSETVFKFSQILARWQEGRGGEGKVFYNLAKKVFFGETGQDDTNDIPLINLLNPALQTGVCVARVTSDISPSLLFRSAPQTCQMLEREPWGVKGHSAKCVLTEERRRPRGLTHCPQHSAACRPMQISGSDPRTLLSSMFRQYFSALSSR